LQARQAPGSRKNAADLGLWNDGQIEPLARIVRLAQEQGCPLAVQLARAGRKASVGEAVRKTGSQPRIDRLAFHGKDGEDQCKRQVEVVIS
jgi:2,4-dienoyl-CoA reductase-like NADH-dependent reductase (Old Yellow Enzyme family)